MNKFTTRRTGMPSVYKATYEEGWKLKNLGNDYGENLMKNFLIICLEMKDLVLL